METLERIIPTDIEGVKEFFEKGNVMVDLKSCPTELKIEAIKYALTLDNLSDPLMILNILNLIKVYNTLDDEFFKLPDIYVNTVEELLDIKLALRDDLKEFSRKLSIYFLSIIKSYNKLTFTPADEHKDLPKLYEIIIMSTDFLTLSGIFSKATGISTDDLMYINNAYLYMNSLIMKGMGCMDMMCDFVAANSEEQQ